MICKFKIETKIFESISRNKLSHIVIHFSKFTLHKIGDGDYLIDFHPYIFIKRIVTRSKELTRKQIKTINSVIKAYEI